MKVLQFTFGAFVEILGRSDGTGKVIANGRAFDARCEGRTEADALTGLAEYYESVARELHYQARLANRLWDVSYTSIPTTYNSPQTVTVRAANEAEAEETATRKLGQSVVVNSVTFNGGAL